MPRPGFHELVPPELISIFTPKELELLISGLPDVDLDDLQVRCPTWLVPLSLLEVEITFLVHPCSIGDNEK